MTACIVARLFYKANFNMLFQTYMSRCLIAFPKINKGELENMTSDKVQGVWRCDETKLLTIPVQKCPPVSSPSVHPVRFSWQKPFQVPLESHGSQTHPFCFLNQTKLGKNCTLVRNPQCFKRNVFYFCQLLLRNTCKCMYASPEQQVPFEQPPSKTNNQLPNCKDSSSNKEPYRPQGSIKNKAKSIKQTASSSSNNCPLK